MPEWAVRSRRAGHNPGRSRKSHMQKVVHIHDAKLKCRIISSLCAVCAVCFLSAGCAMIPEEEPVLPVTVARQDEDLTYATAAVKTDDIFLTARLYCTYRSVETELKQNVAGKTVEEIYVELGDTVRKGQLLAIFVGGNHEAEIRELEYRIARNRLLLEYTETNEAYDRSYRWWNYIYRSSRSDAEEESLKNSLADIGQQYRYLREDYQDAIDMDVRRLEKLRRETEENRLYSDVEGEVSRLLNNGNLKGVTIAETDTFLKVVDNSACLFETNGTQYAGCFKEGEVLTLNMEARGDQAVVRIVPYDMERWGDVIYFDFAEGERVSVPAGASGYLTITLDSRSRVLTLPKEALHAAEDGYYVYVQDDDRLLAVKWVEVGLIGDRLAEIMGGLAEGDQVVLK